MSECQPPSQPHACQGAQKQGALLFYENLVVHTGEAHAEWVVLKLMFCLCTGRGAGGPVRLGPDAPAALGTAGRPGRAIHLAAPDDARQQLTQEAAGFGMV